MLYIYVIFDKLAGQYGAPTVFAKDALAVRWFMSLCSSQEGLQVKDDLELFKVASYDNELCKIEPFQLQLIKRGIDIE